MAAVSLLGLVPRRRRRAQAAEEALAQDQVTAELTAALQDRAVSTYRAADLAVLVIVIILMVVKPF